MLHDLSWLSQEAKNIHQILSSLFFVLATVFLLLGVFLEYFKWPLGQTPVFSVFVGRVLIAAILLSTYPLVANTIADVTEALAQKIGDVNQFNLIREKLGDRFHVISWSWVNLKEDIVIIVCYVAFVLLHFSIYVANAFLVFAWILLYVFSPILIALFILPQTAAATSALYRGLIEVSTWKVVWSVIATLFWSTALSDINKTDFNFLSVLCLCLMLTISLLLTPMVVHALAGAGVSSMSKALGGLTLATAVIPPARVMGHIREGSKRTFNTVHTASAFATRKYFPNTHRLIKALPRFHVPTKPPLFEKNDSKDKKK
jgi:hypothetical protein